MIPKSWPQWNESDWNRALFRHYFEADENDTTVTRLLVTARSLTEAVGSDHDRAAEVEESFRKVLTASPTRINARFRGRDFSFSPPYDEPPRAVLHLLFTCYVASAGDDEVRNVADFRRRMAVLLGHTNEPFYPLEGLGDLWKQFDAWLGKARRAGYPWRRLRLPDPGTMVRIGYSLKLAFPHRHDQALLERIVIPEGFAAQPPLGELLETLRPWRDHFTEGFRVAYEEFRHSLIAGTFNGEHSPLLDAVRDVIMHGEAECAESAKFGRLCLVAERDDRECLRLLLLSDRAPVADSKFGAFEPDRAQEPFRYALTFGHATFEGADTVIEFLLADELAQHWRGFARDPLARIAHDGVLLFHRGASGLLECARSLNVEGDVWPLVHRELAERFRDALAHAHKPEARTFGTAYAEWREFDAIPAARLRAIDWANKPALSTVRCLQQCAPDSRITLVGGVPTGEPRTWFGHRVVLPTVRVDGNAAGVILTREDGALLGHAEHIAGESEGFSLHTFASAAPLEGEHVAMAKFADGRTLRRRICFRAFVDRFAFQGPSKPKRWWCEGAHADMVAWNPAAAFAGVEADGDDAAPYIPWSVDPSAASSTEISGRIAALLEICAARCVRRRDFSEGEWIELFDRVFDEHDPRLKLWVLRAWVEAGLFDQAADVAWRSRRLFARMPHLALSYGLTDTRARLMGLAPAMLVNRLRQEVAEAGGEMVQCPSASHWVAGAWEIRGVERETLEAITRNLSMARAVRVPAPTGLVRNSKCLIRQLLQRPLHYEKYCEWNSVSRRFEKDLRAEKSAVQLEWWQRREQFDAPDYFVVARDGVEEFLSYSRNWALLTAAKLAKAKPFIRAKGMLISDGDPWVFLPLPVGRFCFAAGAAAAGPRRTETGAWEYIYPLGVSSAAQRILVNLGFADETESAEFPPWLEALAVARSRHEPLVPLSIRSLRRRVPASLRALYLAHRKSQ